jgi:hypothetical protein
MGGYDYCENCNDERPMIFATRCCELCGHLLRNLLLLGVANLMLPDHNMMFVSRRKKKAISVDVLLEGPS